MAFPYEFFFSRSLMRAKSTFTAVLWWISLISMYIFVVYFPLYIFDMCVCAFQIICHRSMNRISCVCNHRSENVKYSMKRWLNGKMEQAHIERKSEEMRKKSSHRNILELYQKCSSKIESLLTRLSYSDDLLYCKNQKVCKILAGFFTLGWVRLCGCRCNRYFSCSITSEHSTLFIYCIAYSNKSKKSVMFSKKLVGSVSERTFTIEQILNL